MNRKLYPRKCDECGKGMDEGYIFGCTVYCSDACAFNEDFTKERFLEEYDDDGDSFWTEWDCIDGGEAYNEAGEEIDIPPCVTCGDKEASEVVIETMECGACYRASRTKFKHSAEMSTMGLPMIMMSDPNSAPILMSDKGRQSYIDGAEVKHLVEGEDYIFVRE